ncbi:MAG TPA: DUF397 domain-containing protein [Streptosporangiaceae bacterium]|jgi:hypothetical protein
MTTAFALSERSWRKSSYSGGSEGGSNCVQVASGQRLIAVRDSKHPGQGALSVSPAGWRAFVAGLNAHADC